MLAILEALLVATLEVQGEVGPQVLQEIPLAPPVHCQETVVLC